MPLHELRASDFYLADHGMTRFVAPTFGRPVLAVFAFEHKLTADDFHLIDHRATHDLDAGDFDLAAPPPPPVPPMLPEQRQEIMVQARRVFNSQKRAAIWFGWRRSYGFDAMQRELERLSQ